MDKEVAYLSALFDKLSAIINKVPAVLIVLIPLVLLYVSQNLNGNEEQYMQLAKQYGDYSHRADNQYARLCWHG